MSQELVDQSGRVLGPRAQQTRERLLRATAELLAEQRLRGLSVTRIAGRVGTSPATFYQYFKDVEDALLALAEAAAGALPKLLLNLDASWDGPDGLDAARRMVEAFVEHWDEHGAVLRFRDLAAEEGDPRFARARRRVLLPALERLAERIARAQASEPRANGLHPTTAAAAMLAILERLAASYRALEPLGVTRETLVETCARILHQTVTGRGAA